MEAALCVAEGTATAPVTVDRAELATPVGKVIAAVRGGKLCALGFEEQWPRLERILARRFPAMTLRECSRTPSAVSRLRAYFDGRLDALDDIETDTAGTPFQERVWSTLRTIPTGTTWSYRDLAAAIGCPTAVRAVAAANGANPIGIVVPCHRVIGADGSLTGYGGGLERKAWLLRHEGARPDGEDARS